MDLTKTAAGWIEPAPDRCPNGHLLAGQALVGWQWCPCGGHRTFFCRTCETMTYLPPWAEKCHASNFDGR